MFLPPESHKSRPLDIRTDYKWLSCRKPKTHIDHKITIKNSAHAFCLDQKKTFLCFSFIAKVHGRKNEKRERAGERRRRQQTAEGIADFIVMKKR
jgi:5-methylcytosine-specific restriction endonuclease McrA